MRTAPFLITRFPISQLFCIFAPIVDVWAFYDNSSYNTNLLASSELIVNPQKFNEIIKSCQATKKKI